MSALAKLGALIWRFLSPHSHCWALNHSICLCLLVQVALSGSLKFYTPLKCPYKHSLTSPLLTYKISHDMWEPTSKLGTSIWRFIWLLIRTIPLYLRDRNHLVSASMLLVRPENLQYKKLACAYGDLEVCDLHRTIIYVLCVVCTYHNNAAEFSGTVAIAISPFSRTSAW